MFSRTYLQRKKLTKGIWVKKGSLTTEEYRMPKLQEIFTTVTFVCPHYERFAVLQNVFAIILL